MICPYCGRENPNTQEVCDFCGGNLLTPGEERALDAQIADIPGGGTEPVSEPKLVQPEPDHTSPKPSIPYASPIQQPAGIQAKKPRSRIWWLVGCLVILFIIVICGALIWGISNITNRFSFLNTVTPESSLIQVPNSVSAATQPSSFTPGLIFSDDFSDTGSGWDRVDEADYVTDYYQDAYRITIKTDRSDSWANPDDNVFRDVIVEADATKNAGPDDNDFGLICRYLSVDEFYYAVISSDGYFGITKVTADSSTLLGRDNLEYSDAINQGEATNHIRFECNGSQLTLWVNGTQVDRQTDNAYTTGNVGLIAGSYDTPGTDILFDNFYVYQP